MKDSPAIEAMKDISMELDLKIGSRIMETVDEWGEPIALGVMLNLGTALIARAVLLTPKGKREELGEVISEAIANKILEGRAAIVGAEAIEKARGNMH